VKTVLTNSPDEAADILRRGGLVAFPTETVYGLGADVFNEKAVAAIFKAKIRPADNPLIVHIADRSQIGLVASEVTEKASKLINAFFPGPLTIVLDRTDKVPYVATAGLETVGVRMPRDPLTHQFLLSCKTPVVAPSANLSGRPSPTTWQAVQEDLDSRIDCILVGGPTEIGIESTVIDCTGEVPILLRPGAIAINELEEIVPGIRSAGERDLLASHSPGMRHKHYSPVATVTLITPSEPIEFPPGSAYIGLNAREDNFAIKKVCGSVEEYARDLFEFFRQCDREGVTAIYSEVVAQMGIGAALMDRLRRASRR
jgi:L-threonylcarbamoyladenylate synthase